LHSGKCTGKRDFTLQNFLFRQNMCRNLKFLTAEKIRFRLEKINSCDPVMRIRHECGLIFIYHIARIFFLQIVLFVWRINACRVYMIKPPNTFNCCKSLIEANAVVWKAKLTKLREGSHFPYANYPPMNKLGQNFNWRSTTLIQAFQWYLCQSGAVVRSMFEINISAGHLWGRGFDSRSNPFLMW
jgi:hypothetical protein